MQSLKRALLPLAICAGLGFTGAVNASATWSLNYADSIDALGYGSTTNAVSNLTDEYKYTAESLVLFNDNDSSGGISAGDTFDDFILFRIDQLFLGGGTNSDVDTFAKNAQVSGVISASGLQVTQNDYIVNTSEIEFYFDSVGGVSGGLLGGTDADFSDPNSFDDGVLVQTGDLVFGGGTNSGLVPDGAINIVYALTDILSTLDDQYANFELFDPFIPLDTIALLTDSNNNACPPDGVAACASTVAGLESFFGIDAVNDYDFFFHTRSDGSAVKAAVPNPSAIALVGLGLIGAGFARRFRGRDKA
jgi:hypothetical protein